MCNLFLKKIVLNIRSYILVSSIFVFYGSLNIYSTKICDMGGAKTKICSISKKINITLEVNY